jgi:hypothetical protein
LQLAELTAAFDEDWLLPNTNVCFVGYPEGRYDTKNNLPMLRRGVIASIPKVDFEGRKQFLIDAHVYPGSSGSPVFSVGNVFDGKVSFLGVLNAVMIRNAKLIAMPANLAAGVQQAIGLGFVMKPVLVRELIDDAVTKIKKVLQKDVLLAAVVKGEEEAREELSALVAA